MSAWILTVVLHTSYGWGSITSQAMLYPGKAECEAALQAHVEMARNGPIRMTAFGVCTQTETRWYR